MSAEFVAASSLYITQSDALLTTAGPFTIGFWLKVNALPGGDQELCSISATSAQRTWEIYIKPTGAMGMGYFNGSALGYIDLAASSATAGVWTYFLGRRIANNNTRICSLRAGAINHAQSTVNFTPGALDRINLACLIYNSAGATAFFTGQLAEFFYANADVQPGGAQMDESLLRQIAFCGPLSVPHIAPLVVEYHAMRGPMWQVAGDDYQRGAARSWVPTNGPTFAEHPPLDSTFVRPNQTQTLLAV